MSADDTELKATLDQLQHTDFALPNAQGVALDCDLVMKGGITSGVVYPLAVLNLAQRYRFHSIGGTSAGAIAASVTAAAEYGRENGGFNRLVDVVHTLNKDGFLANVFQPSAELRPLMQLIFLVLDFKRHIKTQTDFIPSRLNLTGGVLKFLWALTLAPAKLPTLVGGLIGAALAALGASGWIVAALQAGAAGKALWQFLWGILIIILCGWLGSLLGTLVQLLRTELPGNDYGLCRGQPVPDHARHRLVSAQGEDSPALTKWLAETIDTLANMPAKQPLTFGLLGAKKVKRPGSNEYIEQPIRLNTVTTNLSQGQPYIMPFTNRQFMFSEEEFRDFFPGPVVDYMVQHAYQPQHFAMPATIVDARGRTHTLRFLPESEHLPVIVGVRMSLSFPILMSAVPLWTISRDVFSTPEFRQRTPGSRFALRAEYVRRNWFSDGGICSNFPIHFYDQLLPPYPTFGINLGQLTINTNPKKRAAGKLPGIDFQWEELTQPDTSQDYSTAPEAHVPEANVNLPSAYPHDRPGPLWEEIDASLPGFLNAIINTGLFYRDIVQSRLPSYYDRIVTIYLNDREGGINLDMPPETIAKIAQQGYKAADEIINKFNFEHHQWVRMRLMLGKLEHELIDLHDPLFPQKPVVNQQRLVALVNDITTFLTENGITQNSVQRVLQAQQQAYAQPATRYPYARDDAWIQAVLPQLYVFLLMIQQWGSAERAQLQLDALDETRAELSKREDHIRLRVTPEL
ncbi:MAG TPA: patatin-like phospholipase family protein, partial [Kouleothrix sp.]|nr:patatin-like phospholipase family protein [Kouleothrix sp.]